MNDIYFEKFENWFQKNNYKSLSLLLSAGFEDRAQAAPLYIANKSNEIKAHAIILDYDEIYANEPNRSKILGIIDNGFSSRELIPSSRLDYALLRCKERVLEGDNLLVDISGMDRILIFKILNFLFFNNIFFNIVYTEAETYYPNKKFYYQLEKIYKSDEIRLLNKYQDLEKLEEIYSYDCDVYYPKEFRGRPEPGRPSVLIAFLTFKRSRLQVILRAFEFSKRILIISKPIRKDLYWRKELLELINYDLIRNRLAEKKEILTLDPFLVCKELEKYIKDNFYNKFNIYLAPLGSKMQTVGSLLFWHRHKGTSIIFSQPKKYFNKKYSKGYRDTFLISYEKIIDFLNSY
jgi:hypothetical protein